MFAINTFQSNAMDEDRNTDLGVQRLQPCALFSTHSTSHHPAIPNHGNLKKSSQRHRRKTYHFSLFIILIFFLSFASATASIFIDEQLIEESRDIDSPGSALERLAITGTILVDQRPKPKAWRLATVNDDLRRRGDSSSSATATTASSTLAPSSSSSGKVVAAIDDTTSSLPTPFDSGYSSNVTSTCSAFITDFLSNSTFQSCLPFSLLLQNSMSFFQAEKSFVRITQTLDATCSANQTICVPLMADLASNITTSSACKTDYDSQNPLVTQAHLGLLAYQTLYSASCLLNPETSAYCFADAVTNSSSSTDSYIYYLPLNVSLPGGSQPTCNSCLKNTMAIFDAATANRKSAIASDYIAAATQVNVQCGPNFVNATLAAAASSGSSGALVPSNMGILALGIVVLGWLL